MQFHCGYVNNQLLLNHFLTDSSFAPLKGLGNVPVGNEVTRDFLFVTEFYPIPPIVHLHVGATLFSKFLKKQTFSFSQKL